MWPRAVSGRSKPYLNVRAILPEATGAADSRSCVHETAGFLFGALVGDRIFLEIRHAAFQVSDHQISQIAADAVAHQNPHDHQRSWRLGGME
jgi:hypothetical protein